MTPAEINKYEQKKTEKLRGLYKPKSFSVALLLLIFLGWLGAHRFYLDKPFSGLLYLCTMGLSGIGIIYDLVTLKSQVDEINEKNDYVLSTSSRFNS